MVPYDKLLNNVVPSVPRHCQSVSPLLLQMDLHEAQQKGGGGGPIGSPHEINNLKQQLQDTKKKLESAEKTVEEKSKLCTELENKMKVISEQ